MSEYINNSQQRKNQLKSLIRSLHEGNTKESVIQEFQKHFSTVSTTEISQIEQELIKEGLAVEEVQRLCDVHAAVFDGAISDIHATKDYSSIIGHPVNVLQMENKAIESVIREEIIPYFETFKTHPDKTSILMLRVGFDRLSEVDIHYQRKEQIIFPYLEKHGITAPPKVMWGVDDDIRADIKRVITLLNDPHFDATIVIGAIDSAIQKTLDMISKENNILIPLISETFTFYEWIKIDGATPELGYCLVKPEKTWKVESPEITQNQTPNIPSETIEMDAGHLSPNEINAILNTLPLDLTFVDANNKVKYFTQGQDRIFLRPKTIIGREVSMCHPPASVHIVEKIIDDFRLGKKDHEDFWIKMGQQFVYIRYYAVRDAQNNYLGTLEVTQNIKPITELQGEKRLVSE